MSGDVTDQEIQVSPHPLPPAFRLALCSAAALCLVTIWPLPHYGAQGFGFVTFMDQAGVDKVLAQSRHELDSKTVGVAPGASGVFGRGRSLEERGRTLSGVAGGGGQLDGIPGERRGVWLIEGLPRSETLSVELRETELQNPKPAKRCYIPTPPQSLTLGRDGEAGSPSPSHTKLDASERSLGWG